ncbi:hypothetical protein Emed_006381 [Eimeria media]
MDRDRAAALSQLGNVLLLLLLYMWCCAAAAAAVGLKVEGVESVLIGAGFVSVVKSGDTDWDELRPLVEDAISGNRHESRVAPSPAAAAADAHVLGWAFFIVARIPAAAALECAAEAAAAEKEESAAAAAAAAAAKAEEKASAPAPLAEEDAELFESIKETLNHRRGLPPPAAPSPAPAASAAAPAAAAVAADCCGQSDGGDLEVLRFDRERGELYVHLLGSCRGCPSSTVTVKRGMEQMLRYYYPEILLNPKKTQTKPELPKLLQQQRQQQQQQQKQQQQQQQQLQV